MQEYELPGAQVTETRLQGVTIEQFVREKETPRKRFFSRPKPIHIPSTPDLFFDPVINYERSEDEQHILATAKADGIAYMTRDDKITLKGDFESVWAESLTPDMSKLVIQARSGEPALRSFWFYDGIDTILLFGPTDSYSCQDGTNNDKQIRLYRYLRDTKTVFTAVHLESGKSSELFEVENVPPVNTVLRKRDPELRKIYWKNEESDSFYLHDTLLSTNTTDFAISDDLEHFLAVTSNDEKHCQVIKDGRVIFEMENINWAFIYSNHDLTQGIIDLEETSGSATVLYFSPHGLGVIPNLTLNGVSIKISADQIEFKAIKDGVSRRFVIKPQETDPQQVVAEQLAV